MLHTTEVRELDNPFVQFFLSSLHITISDIGVPNRLVTRQSCDMQMGRAQLRGGIYTRGTMGLEEVLKCHLFHDVLRRNGQDWM